MQLLYPWRTGSKHKFNNSVKNATKACKLWWRFLLTIDLRTLSVSDGLALALAKL